MVNRVVATKLTEEEHSKLLYLCNQKGCTPSALLKESIMERLKSSEKKDMTDEKIREFLGLKPKYVGIVQKERLY